MKKKLKYVSYVIRHKWFVMIECFKVGSFIGGITHDLSKFLPSEFFPYAGNDWSSKEESPEFDRAWLLHQKRNKHHWQYWILIKDDGKTKLLEMPLKYRKEMLCDWRGAGKAQGYGDNTKEWYKKNEKKIKLAPLTKRWIRENI